MEGGRGSGGVGFVGVGMGDRGGKGRDRGLVGTAGKGA